MRSPQSLRNGDTPSPLPRIPHFQSTLSIQKLRRFNSLILVFRLGAFCFSFAASVFMVTNSRGSNSPHWYDYDAFRFVFAANAIVAIYSLFEMGRLNLGNFQRNHFLPRNLTSLVRFRTRSGFRIPAAVGGLGGDRVGEDIERDGRVYGHKCFLCAVRYIGGFGICRVFIYRAFISFVGVSSGLFYNQWLSFSFVAFRVDRGRRKGNGGMFRTA
ncbi:CASP-like protein [Melia azedarach]|uniref:CASP-like protein n=1 Tax=Melia azedarach TaxID=155640 RepID=A0ACC1YBA4_MELAZ|nr:CASP-like protein [Melia azedarach]